MKKYTRIQKVLIAMAASGHALCRNELADMSGIRTEHMCYAIGEMLEKGLVRVVGMKKSSVTGAQGQAIGLTESGHREAAKL